MVRTKTGITRRKKHKKVLKLAKGYRQQKSKIFRRAQEAVLHTGQYAYHGRKLKKRSFRRLWILRISEAVKKEGLKLFSFVGKNHFLILDNIFIFSLILQ